MHRLTADMYDKRSYILTFNNLNQFVHWLRVNERIEYSLNYILLTTNHQVPPPFRPGNPALCGSRPLVTPYYCRLGDLLCYTCMLYLSTFLCVYACVFCVFFVLCVVFLCSFLQYFDTVGWVF